jgi:PAS domain S-box-containing protein
LPEHTVISPVESRGRCEETDSIQDNNDECGEFRFRTLVEAISHVVFTLDDRGHFTYLSPRCEEILGLPPEALIGKTITSVVIPDDKDRLCRKYEKVKAGESYPSDYRVLDKNGKEHHVRAVSRPFGIPGGKRGVVGVISEISNWETIDQALRQSEEKVKKLLEYSKDGIILTDESGTLIEWSPAMEQISGIPRSGAVGRPIWDVQYEVLPTEQKIMDTRNRMREMFGNLLATGTAPWLDRSSENEIERPDMTRRIIESFQFVIPTGNGRMIAAIVRDITDRKRADLAVQEANRKLNLMSSITRHDISNQLAILTGYLSLLEQGSSAMGRDEIFTHVRGSATMIRRILQFTTEYQEIGVKSPVWQDLAGTIAAATVSMEKGRVEIKLDPSCSDMEIFADPLLARVFYNLIDNSLRHGGAVTEIRFRCSARKGDCIIGYEDNGVGIPDEIRPVLFMRGRGKNTGFGLFLIREILAITGYTIQETGEAGKGARFEITVPRGSFRSMKKGTNPAR